MPFSNFLFLILVLFVLNMVPGAVPEEAFANVHYAFWCGMALYGMFLGCILLQNYSLRKQLYYLKGRLFAVVNIEFLFFLLVYHFVFAAHRLLETRFEFPVYLFSLILYFFALGTFYISAFMWQSKHSRWKYAMLQTSLQIRFLLPFVAPFVIFALLMDALKLYPIDAIYNYMDTPFGQGFAFMGSLIFMALVMIFLPALIQWVWGCEPIREESLKNELEAFCERVGFKHAGMKVWTIFNQSVTAGIIGLVPRYRYVMFTQGLLHAMSPRLVIAVLAHEMGHSYRRHLLLIPAVLFGMMVCIGLFSIWFVDGLIHYLNLKEFLSESTLWPMLAPFVIIVPLGVMMALYFRYVFGYYSRLFERQADLHCFQVDIPPHDMIEALDKLAIATGHSHNVPSWHHFSINERIHFLKQAIDDRSLIEKHHRYVKKAITAYFIGLFLACILMFSTFQTVENWNDSISQHFNKWLTSSTREEGAEYFIQKYDLPNTEQVREAIKNGLLHSDAVISGVAEFYAASALYRANDLGSSLTLMTAALQKVDVSQLRPEAIAFYKNLAQQILTRTRNEAEFGNKPLELEAALYHFLINIH